MFCRPRYPCPCCCTNQDGSDDRDRSETPRRPSFQATVEDTDEDGNPIPPARTHDSAKQVRKSRSSSADEDEHGRVAKKSKRAHHGSGKQQHGGTVAPAKQTKAKTPFGVKYWVTERTTGAFHRTFNFPSRVDQDRVTATLRDGLLSIYVPKLREQRGRKKITIVC
ncbi:hypothetical protein KEM52_000693 [Ascosphaera acerosa]|nr:hypothetical protein KEM52_000693 [Ascosphaera acerosa]